MEFLRATVEPRFALSTICTTSTGKNCLMNVWSCVAGSGEVGETRYRDDQYLRCNIYADKTSAREGSRSRKLEVGQTTDYRVVDEPAERRNSQLGNQPKYRSAH